MLRGNKEARERVEEAALSYLNGYEAKHSIRLYATNTDVRSDSQRYNDYQRAFKLAMHRALIDLSLPHPY